jgi:YggT family protein
MSLIMQLIAALIDLYSLLILAAVVMSWLQVDVRKPPAAYVFALTEPALEPIRRALPPMGGLDLSPMLLLVALQFLKRLL